MKPKPVRFCCSLAVSFQCPTLRCGHRHDHAAKPVSSGQCTGFYWCKKRNVMANCRVISDPRTIRYKPNAVLLSDNSLVSTRLPQRNGQTVLIKVLRKRLAECFYCKSRTQSFDSEMNSVPAYFEYRPDKDTDLFACGCKSWD
jgi:hypothetical protein